MGSRLAKLMALANRCVRQVIKQEQLKPYPIPHYRNQLFQFIIHVYCTNGHQGAVVVQIQAETFTFCRLYWQGMGEWGAKLGFGFGRDFMEQSDKTLPFRRIFLKGLDGFFSSSVPAPCS